MLMRSGFFTRPRPLVENPERISIYDVIMRSEEHTSELQSHLNLVCRLLLEKKNKPLTQTVRGLLETTVYTTTNRISILDNILATVHHVTLSIPCYAQATHPPPVHTLRGDLS